MRTEQLCGNLLLFNTISLCKHPEIIWWVHCKLSCHSSPDHLIIICLRTKLIEIVNSYHGPAVPVDSRKLVVFLSTINNCPVNLDSGD